MCAWTLLPNGKARLSTADLTINYLQPAKCGELVCEAEVLHAGSRLITVDARCYSKDKPSQTLAVARGSFSVYNDIAEDLAAMLTTPPPTE
jgi:uncharacterized protein (TIGR00369 family)